MPKVSISVQVLDAIAGSDGMRFSEIQRKVCDISGIDYDEKKADYRTGKMQRRRRGWWCINLLGATDHVGLLHYFCVKGQDGNWRRNDVYHRGHPWKTMREAGVRTLVHY